jgi:Glycosyl transferases group 1
VTVNPIVITTHTLQVTNAFWAREGPRDGCCLIKFSGGILPGGQEPGPESSLCRVNFLPGTLVFGAFRSVNTSTDLLFIYFGNDWFAENRTSSHHIAKRLGSRFSLLYVESPGLRAPRVSSRDFGKICKKLGVAFRGPKQIGPRMWHVSVPQIPFRRFPAVRKLNEVFARWKLKRAVRNLSLGSAVSWFTVPHPGFLAGTLGERLVVYYCIDSYAALPDVDAAEVAKMDDALSRRADLVFAASPGLVASKQEQNSRVIYSPHGVDADLFGRAADSAQPVAEGARNLSHPLIGFFGVLDNRIDFDLIRFLALRRPQWNFLLVGHIAGNISTLNGLENVHMPGAVRYETLPDWARAFDVCIMPYRQDAFSANANPLKLREYLATGRPVVSVPMPEVDRFGANIAIRASKQDFLEAIEKELVADSEEKRKARMELVRADTWDARVESVVSLVRQALGEAAS